MTEGPGAVACGCNNHPTTATVRISGNKKSNKNNKAEIRSENKAQISSKIEKKHIQDKFKTGKLIKENHRLLPKNKPRRLWRSR